MQADCTWSSVRVCVCACVCRCLGQVTLGMHCPFVLSCSCASARALSLIHTDLGKSDVKNVARQHLIPFVISEENVYLFGDVLGQMELRGWGCGGWWKGKFNLTKTHALIGTQIRIAA